MSVPTGQSSTLVPCVSRSCQHARHELGSQAYTECLSKASGGARGGVAPGAPPMAASAGAHEEGVADLELDGFASAQAREARLEEFIGDAVKSGDAAAYLESAGWSLDEDSPYADIAEALSEADDEPVDGRSPDAAAAGLLVSAGAYLDTEAAAQGLGSSARDAFVAGHLEGILFTAIRQDEMEEGDEGTGDDDPAAGSSAEREQGLPASDAEDLAAGARDFFDANAPDLIAYAARRGMGQGQAMEYAGHDFALTRGGHGAGFWDRGVGAVGERLSDASRPHGETNVVLRPDGSAFAL